MVRGVVHAAAQAYAGDELGYDNTPITQDMHIALVDVGAVDGADLVTQVLSSRHGAC